MTFLKSGRYNGQIFLQVSRTNAETMCDQRTKYFLAYKILNLKEILRKAQNLYSTVSRWIKAKDIQQIRV